LASQFLQLLLACEATATAIGFYSPLFVACSDVIFQCEIKKHCFNPHFRYSVAAVPITSITPPPTKSKSKCQPKSASPTAWIRYCRDWTSAPYISLRSGMFKHPKVVPITAAKRESKEQLRTETIHAIPTGMVTRLPIRQMLAAARSQETQVLEKPQHRAWSGRTRGKILCMPRRSCDDSCNT
jgi:hypothetical protein